MKKKGKFKKYRTASEAVVEEYSQGFMQFRIKPESIIKRMTKMLGIFYVIQRKDIHFSGQGVVKICLHFVLHLPSDSQWYSWFSTFLLNNSKKLKLIVIVGTLQLWKLDETDIFNTIEKNTLNMNVVKSKSISDSDTEFIMK